MSIFRWARLLQMSKYDNKHFYSYTNYADKPHCRIQIQIGLTDLHGCFAIVTPSLKLRTDVWFIILTREQSIKYSFAGYTYTIEGKKGKLKKVGKPSNGTR